MPFSPQRTVPPEDQVRVLVKGSEFTEWYDVDLDSDIFTPADGFSLTGTVPESRFLGVFREGVNCDIYIGPDRQMAGVIDDVDIDITRERTQIAIAGRDLGSYLVDSEAKAERFSNYSLGDLARHLLKPEWGIKNVIISNDDNRKVQLGKKEKERFKAGKKQLDGTKKTRKHTKIDPGQTVRQILDQHCMRQGLTWWMTAQGDLFIGKPQYFQYLAFEFYLYDTDSKSARNNNVLAAKVKRSISERYSEIVVVGESSADGSGKPGIFDENADDSDDVTPLQAEQAQKAKRAKKYRGTATDPDLVARGINRRLIIADNDALSNEMCREKAEADMQRRRLSGFTLSLTVDGFKQDGKLFTTDCIARVVIEEAGIDGVYWISQRKFREERGQRRTTLTLHEKDVWLP